MEPRLRIVALFLCAALGAVWWLSLRFGEETPGIEVEREASAREGARVDSGSSSSPAPAEAREPEAFSPLPEVDLAVSGRVVNLEGDPIAAIEVSATRRHFASETKAPVTGRRSPETTWSQGDGSFEIRGLDEGEYLLETRETGRFAPARVLVQAGGLPVDLVLREGLLVHGTVTNARGEALERVTVRAQGRVEVLAHTDHQGTYQLYLERESEDEGGLYTLRFYLQGYTELRLPLPAPEREGAREVRLDAALQAVEITALVTGVVETERGEPVSGATVVMARQQGPKYQAASGSDGNFSFSNVELGRGYHLRVLAPPPFRDYTDGGLQVTEAGLSLEIVLEPLATGRLTGRMVDVEGSPLPGLSLWLESSAAALNRISVSSDDRGYFEVDEVPAGRLISDKHGPTWLHVSGLEIRAGEEANVILVLDSGDQEIAGAVLDNRGEPVSDAGVLLVWSHSSGGIRSSSHRSTHTDARGSFRFSRLGPGEHLLVVQAEGYHMVKENRAADRSGEEVKIHLDPDA
jgi:protocatechuate 3,4-dioxygenase beta subunit